MKIKTIRKEALKIRSEYPISTLEDLENIARTEYGVAGVIHTPLAWKQARAVTRIDGKRFIFYYDFGKLYTPIALSHEIGHFAAKHQDGYNPNRLIKEVEADSFAAGLLDMSLRELNKIRLSEGWKRFKEILKNPDKYKNPDPREVERLKRMNVYWLL